MEAVWTVLITFIFVLIVFLVLAFRFPDALKELLGRTRSISITTEGLVVELVEAVVQEKEHRKLAVDEILPMLKHIRSNRRILWVDDVPANNRLEIQALRGLGIDVDTATSNSEAVAYASAVKYDLVLSDIGRTSPRDPDETGLALPELLRVANVDVAIAYYVGHAEAHETSEGAPVFDRPSELFKFIAESFGTRS